MSTRTREIGVIVLTATLLGGVVMDRRKFHVAPDGAVVAAYQSRVRSAAATVTPSVGPWLATDTEVPTSALALLHPNTIISRRYSNFDTGLSADFLLVHCADIRDLLGHYPPNCYVANGWSITSADPAVWEVGGLHINGTRYSFAMTRHGVESHIIVFDFMVLPDGSTCPDMVGVDAAARDPRKNYGAAQVQVVCDASMPEGRQDEALRTLIANYLPVIDAIRRGAPV